MVFSDQSNYLYNVLLRTLQHDRTFDVFNAFDWLLILSFFGGMLALVMAIILHFRVRAIMLLLTASPSVQALHYDYPNGFHYTSRSSVAPSTIVQKLLQEILPVDLTFLLLFAFFLILFFGYLLFKYRKSVSARTTLVLEISDDSRSLSCQIGHLPYSPGFYRFAVNRQETRVELVQSFFRLHSIGVRGCLSLTRL